MIETGSKVHVIYRALFEQSNRRHFLGVVTAHEGVVCRIEGSVFILDTASGMYERRPEKRTTIIDLAESGYIVNIIDSDVDLESVTYRYQSNVGLTATDGKSFSLNINEFGPRS